MLLSFVGERSVCLVRLSTLEPIASADLDYLAGDEAHVVRHEGVDDTCHVLGLAKSAHIQAGLYHLADFEAELITLGLRNDPIVGDPGVDGRQGACDCCGDVYIVERLMRKLSLDSLTLTDTQPQDLIRAAAAAGFDLVSLWVQAPALYPSPLVTPDKVDECVNLLSDTGLEVVSLECFDLHSEAVIESYRAALEIGARLGGKTALAINFSNSDASHTAALLARFAEIARECGLGVNLEPVAGGQSPRLAQARAIIRASGADVGICLDPHHLFRSGDSIADLETGSSPGEIRYVQVCDGPFVQPAEIMRTEAICERLYPGDGEFPLADFLRAAPKGIPLGIECPSLSRAESGRSAVDQAREAIATVRRLLDVID